MPPSTSTIAFTGGRVVTMNGDEVIEDGVVLVEGNRIKAVGRRGEVAIARGGEDLRCHRKDRPARLRGCPLPRLLRRGRRSAAAELAQRRLARVRRHDHPRSFERHGRGLQRRRARARRPLPRAAHLLDRHDPLRRRRRLQGRDRLDRRRALPPASHEGRRRDLGQELPAAAPRAAPADPRRRARDRHHGRPRRRIALRDEHEHGRGRAHDHRAHDSRSQHLPGRRGALASRARSATRRPSSSPTAASSGKSTGTPRRTSGRTRGSRSSSRRSFSTRAPAAARWRPTTSGTTSTRQRSPRSSTRTASPSTPERTASARGWGSTGRSGCWRREACRRSRRCAARL